MPKFVFESLSTHKQFEVLKFNQAEGTVTLKGPLGVVFEDTYTKERFAQMGYVFKQLPDEAPAPPAAPGPSAAAPPPPVSPVVVA
jgi:hypothetical protein